MIQDLITLLKLSDYYGESEYIEQAKGRYAMPNNFKELRRSIKRTLRWQSKKQ